MAIQTIFVGTTPGDGTGDPARTAFTKINDNFTAAENAAAHLLLGTVSQSGGVPTGAIIERGSNANGEYAKFADGTMICVSTNRSLVFENASNMRTTWTYPASFASISFVTGNLISSALGITRQFSQIGAYDRNTTWAYVSALSLAQFVSGDAALGTMDCYAIGRWY